MDHVKELGTAIKDGIKNGIKISAIALIIILLYSIFLLIVPLVFDALYSDAITNETISFIKSNSSGESFPIALLKWERNYFISPYSENKIPETGSLDAWVRGFGFVKINGTYHLFIRSAPMSWKIKYRLANCGEYAQVFTYLMNKSGYHTRLVTAPAEDHMWAEYYEGNEKIVVETSGGYIINNTKTFATGRNWSYIVSLDIFNTSDSIDVSDEYIDRENLSVKIKDNGQNARDVQITVLSPFLMQADPSRYNIPNPVVSNSTDEYGLARFKLGPKNYILQLKKNYFLFSYICSKNISVITNHENYVDIDINKEKCEWKFLN